MIDPNTHKQEDGALTQMSDEQLVVAALVGSFRAYDELVRRYRAGVILVVDGILHCRAAAEDAAQDVFLLAFKALPSLEQPERFAGWLYAIARNRARRLATKEWRARPMSELSDSDALVLASSNEIAATQTDASDPVRQVEQEEERAIIQGLLGGLKPEHQEVLTLRYYEEWPLERIASFLSLPEPTVRGRLHRARAALRDALLAASGNGTKSRTRKKKGVEPIWERPMEPAQIMAAV